MTASESLLFCMFLALTFAITLEQPSLPENPVSAPDVQHSSLLVELELLKSKIASLVEGHFSDLPCLLLLELSIDERNHQLSKKDKSIKEMQKIIQDKSDNISLLQIEIKLLQESSYGKEYMSKSDQQVDELEKQVERLRTDLDKQNKRKYGLGLRAYVAEKKIQQLNAKLEKLYTVNDEQETIIRKTAHLLQVAEEELMKVELETALLSTGLNWDWAPILKEQWLAFVTFVMPRVQLLMEKFVDVYHVAKNYIAPCAIKALKDLYFHTWEVKNLIESYLYHAAMVAKSLLSKTFITLKPYTIKVLYECKTFMTFLAQYHLQVQELLKDNEFMRPVANMELAWFVATALLALPALFLFKLFSVVFRNLVVPKSIKKYNGNRS
ncbi:hypothetical protein G4B88_009900 [Cannabis sativa]|uniref:Uncharacterized protein n=1 Tax=Cannabis sativa TaxID=3483 RepID=A0A7J6HJK1_CANSA|nr:hypothetical protein G4B88_009900 [Cannabis sativa]